MTAAGHPGDLGGYPGTLAWLGGGLRLPVWWFEKVVRSGEKLQVGAL